MLFTKQRSAVMACWSPPNKPPTLSRSRGLSRYTCKNSVEVTVSHVTCHLLGQNNVVQGTAAALPMNMDTAVSGLKR